LTRLKLVALFHDMVIKVYISRLSGNKEVRNHSSPSPGREFF